MVYNIPHFLRSSITYVETDENTDTRDISKAAMFADNNIDNIQTVIVGIRVAET